MRDFSCRQMRSYLLSFGRGDLVVEELSAFVRSRGINTGLVTAGIGSFDLCRLHTITSTGLPPQERFVTLRGPLEIGSLQGSIADGEPHIHVVLHDVANDAVHIGHLESGSRCCYRIEVGILAFEGTVTRKRMDPTTQLVDIVAEDADAQPE